MLDFTGSLALLAGATDGPACEACDGSGALDSAAWLVDALLLFKAACGTMELHKSTASLHKKQIKEYVTELIQIPEQLKPSVSFCFSDSQPNHH